MSEKNAGKRPKKSDNCSVRSANLWNLGLLLYYAANSSGIINSAGEKIDSTTTQLITAAKSVCGDFQLGEDFSAGSVGAVILTARGSIYTGICICLGCGLGFCAQAAAVAEMLKHRETHISAAVAIPKDGILPPCGWCREMMLQIDVRNLDSRVIVGEGHVTGLRALLPDHWLVHST